MVRSGCLRNICTRLLGLPLLLLVAVACRNPAELRWAVQRGTIFGPGVGSSTVTLPSQFVAGQPAPVTVYTQGGGCVRAAYTNSRVAGDTAVVEPFDSVVVQLPPNTACTSEFRWLPHSVSVIFPQAGSGTIRIVGWNGIAGVDTTLTYSVTVQ